MQEPRDQSWREWGFDSRDHHIHSKKREDGACMQGAGRCADGVCLLFSPISFLSECFRFLTDKAEELEV